MKKGKKVKNNSPIILLFIAISAVLVYFAMRIFVMPLASIYFSDDKYGVPTLDLSNDQYENIIAIRDSWDWKVFENYKMRMPNYQELEIDSTDNEDSRAFQIVDPESGEHVSILVTRTETDLDSVEDLLPENAEENILYGFTLIGEYDALRVGPLEPPYDTVSYFILEDGYIYEISAIFSTPVVFLDQVLSTFTIEQSNVDNPSTEELTFEEDQEIPSLEE